MKTLKLSLLFIFISLSLFASSPKSIYIYRKDVEGRESKATWTIEEKDKIWKIQGETMNSKTLIIATPTQINTQSFSYQSKSSSNQYSIHREGDILIVTKETDGKKIEKNLSLDGDTWVQEFDFSFKPYILSEKIDFEFSIVHPKKLSLHSMVATKRGFDQIDLNGKVFTALKVKVTLRGFKKMFWHADLWFEQGTGDLLKYEANEGPNTPTSIITLFSKQIG